MRTHQKYTEKFEPTKSTMRIHLKYTEKFERTKSRLLKKAPHQKYIEISDPTKRTNSNPKTHQKYNFLNQKQRVG